MATYKTKDGLDYLLPGIGHTVNGEITTDQVIEHPRFELVHEDVAAAPAPVATPETAPVQPTPVATPQPVAPAVAPTNQQEIK